jgi:hypothetical protein
MTFQTDWSEFPFLEDIEDLDYLKLVFLLTENIKTESLNTTTQRETSSGMHTQNSRKMKLRSYLFTVGFFNGT